MSQQVKNPDLSEAFKHTLLVVKSLGGDPVAFAQGFFNSVWDKMPHIVPFLSEYNRKLVNDAIEEIVNKQVQE